MFLFLTDIDECDDFEIHQCSQICLNFNGSYECDCEDGYVLSSNNRQCIGIYMYMASCMHHHLQNTKLHTLIVYAQMLMNVMMLTQSVLLLTTESVVTQMVLTVVTAYQVMSRVFPMAHVEVIIIYYKVQLYLPYLF